MLSKNPDFSYTLLGVKCPLKNHYFSHTCLYAFSKMLIVFHHAEYNRVSNFIVFCWITSLWLCSY